MHSFFERFCHSTISRRAAVMQVALAWSSTAFCGEIHDAASGGYDSKSELLFAEHCFIAAAALIVLALLFQAIRTLFSGRFRLATRGVWIVPAALGCIVALWSGMAQRYWSEKIKTDAVFETFHDVIETAHNYGSESLGGALNYPSHSIVVYSFDSSGGSYHRACPREWLATTKEGVRLVILVSRGNLERIGRYEPTGVTAFETIWNVVFVDLSSQHIVARTSIVERDPSTVGPTSLLDRDHSSPPTESEVVSAIQKTVTFWTQ